MEVEYEQPGTPFKCEKYEIEPKDDSIMLCFGNNVEQVLSERYVETLIIEVVEDEDELYSDFEDKKSERNRPLECALIKQELSENVESEHFAIKNELEFKQEFNDESFNTEQFKDEPMTPPFNLVLSQDYADEGDLDTGDFLGYPIKKVESKTLRKASNEYVVGGDPDYCPVTDSNSFSESEEEFVLNGYEEETRRSPGKRRFPCSVCKKSFSRQCHLNRHITSHTGKIPKHNTHSPRRTKQPFSCKMCGKRFAWMRNLKDHVEQLHHPARDEEYQCYHCDKVFRKKQLLVKHMKVHGKMKPFQCAVCHKSFAMEHTLKWHQVIHSVDQYSCPVCEESFAKLHNLMTHRFQFHRRLKHPCKVCPRRFKFQASLVKHLKEHSLEDNTQGAMEDNDEKTICSDDDDEGPFLCDICGESFSLMKFITRHKLSHEKPFQCEFCGKRFSRQGSLLQHFRSHLDKAKFQCDVCGKRFLLKSKFSRHKKKHSQEPGSFLCDACGKLFVTRDGFFNHMRIHRKKSFECHICGQYFARAVFYHDHMKRHKKRLFKCTFCPLDFSRHEHLKSHMQIHDEETNLNLLSDSQPESTRTLENRRQFPARSGKMKVKERVPHRCKICSKTFPFQSSLSHHEKCHSKVQSFKCPVCSKTLKTNLERHMKTHSDERPFECTVCKKRFRIRDQMYKHMKTHAVEPPFICSVCSKGFFSSFALALHRRAHSDGEPYQCKLCDRKFYQMSLLQTHMRQHTGDKPFQCEICEKRFAIKALLGKHQKNNPEKKSFPCPDCDRRFCFKRDLTVHMIDHNGNRCSFCGKEFHGQYDLKVHIRSHTGDAPYECLECKRRFTTKSTLNRHALLHTGEKPFKCHICTKRFRRNVHLKGHMENIHGVGSGFEEPRQVETATTAKKTVVIKVIPIKKMKTTL